MAHVLAIDYRFFACYRWAIVDASLREELPASWPLRVIAPAFLGDDSGRCPLLIDLQGLADNDQYALLERLSCADNSPLSLVLESDGSLEQLLAHLRERLLVRDASGEIPRQFRYYDPGTFLQLPPLLGEAGMRWLFGPVTAIAVPWCGEWRRYGRPDGKDAASFSLRDCLPGLLRLSAVNRVLARLTIDNQENWCRKAAITSQHLARAEKHGLMVRDDQVAFALHAWQHHPRFDDHPIIHQLLKELAESKPEDELDYRELSVRIDEADWLRITRELNTPSIGQPT